MTKGCEISHNMGLEKCYFSRLGRKGKRSNDGMARCTSLRTRNHCWSEPSEVSHKEKQCQETGGTDPPWFCGNFAPIHIDHTGKGNPKLTRVLAECFVILLEYKRMGGLQRASPRPFPLSPLLKKITKEDNVGDKNKLQFKPHEAVTFWRTAKWSARQKVLWDKE